MPLPMRRVEPVHVSRGTLPERFRIQNDLEAVSNGTLANVIVQLSSLSHHAEELFGNLIRVESEIANRANNLQARIDRLAVKVVQMDNNQDELGSMQEALNTKPFQSSMSFDQQVVSRYSMPAAMLKTYKVCDQPPPLDKLNGYRDDGKDGLKFYTDPSYFFDLWRQEMLKDTDKIVKKPHKPKQEGGQKHKKRVRQPPNTRDRHRHIAIEQGEHIMQGQEYHRPAQEVTEVPDGVIYQQDPNSAIHNRQPQSVARSGSIEIEKGYSESQYGNGMDTNSRGDYRSSHLLQNQSSSMLNRNISQSQYDYESYNHQVHNQSQQRYYPHVTPPPAYSDMSSPSPNAYSISSRFSNSGIAASSTPRNGTLSINVTPSSNSMTNGYAFRPSQPPPAPPPNYVGTPPNLNSHSAGSVTPTRSATRMMSSRDTLPPPPPPPSDNEHNHINGHHNGISVMPPPPPMHDDEHEDSLPPPPPPPDALHHHMNNSIENLAPSPDLAPPPPPPFPIGEALNINNSEKCNLLSNGGIGKKPLEKKVIPVPAWDGRSELLKAIRDGINLRKVETKKEPNGKEDKSGGTYGDVASILARRVAVEMSDSDSGSGSEYDSDQWDEASA
ncbi:wiskott-Aldrich syndrome protein family member 2 isoform X2 [Folsomia candida]|uniref:wiskott-Aldrich syndrome protein family member 2 isoform X2 n=1 Tax=Folsomia candida TaxID=158441 RepID=UPI000B8F1ADC|nr:wiskott-Aldrich syndrome protein family member 2 isoform X2 [Folsomia candida]